MDNIKLTETVKAAQAGDKSALTRLYLEYAKTVYFLALKLMKNKEAAEDITQEVFIYVYQKITQLREPEAFRAWLSRITASKCTNALTRNREPLSTDIEEVAETDFLEEADPLLVPERALDNAETARMIVDIIDALPTPQRVCMYYYYYEHLTVMQIAEVLNANESTVKSRLALARDKIRKELERLNKEEGIKLYGVAPLMLAPILDMALREFKMPSDVLTEILDNVTARAGANAAASAQTAADMASSTAASQAAEAAASSATAGKAAGYGGFGLGTKIAIAACGVIVAAGLLFGVNAAVNTLTPSVPEVTQEEFDRAAEENAALKKRLSESAEPAADSLKQPVYEAQPVPGQALEPESEQELKLESDLESEDSVSEPSLTAEESDFNQLSSSDYRRLNEFLTEMEHFPSIASMTDDDSLILFGAYISTYINGGEWGESGSKESVEAILNRYFGVEKINHEKSSHYRSWEGWDRDYPIDGIGGVVIEWVNATNYKDLRNGTFSVDVDSYFAPYWDDSFFGAVSDWKLKNGGKIIDGDWNSWDGDNEGGNIIHSITSTVTLVPCVYSGENTWQIVGINSYKVPKNLLAD